LDEEREDEAETVLDEESEAPPEGAEDSLAELEYEAEASLDGDESAIDLIYTRKRSCRTEGYREEVGRQRNAWKKRKWKWKKR
jgi:hypothetical protein